MDGLFFLPRFLRVAPSLGVLDSQFHAEVASGVGKDVEVIMESSDAEGAEERRGAEVTTPQFPRRNKHCRFTCSLHSVGPNWSFISWGIFDESVS